MRISVRSIPILIFGAVYFFVANGAQANSNCETALIGGSKLSPNEVLEKADDILIEAKSRLIDLSQKEPVFSTASFTVSEIVPSVYSFSFSAQREMTKTLLRFQEFYESPMYRGQPFKLKEFKDWYKTTREHGRFSYYTDWAGYNFPSYVMQPFLEGQFKPLSSRETAIVDFFRSRASTRWYFIGAYSATEQRYDELDTVVHELAHAFYYLDPQYKTEVDAVLAATDPMALVAINNMLKAEGYHEQVFSDEQQAYLILDWRSMIGRGIITPDQVSATVYKLIQIYWKKLSSL